MKYTHTFLLLILYFHIGFAQSNEGTNLWFGFMEHRDVGQTTMVAMITSKQATSGTIKMPLLDWSMPFSVAANDVVVIQLPQSAETRGSENITKTGVQITSVAPVSAYIHQYFEFRSEASIVLPIEAINMEYFVMSYTGIENRG